MSQSCTELDIETKVLVQVSDSKFRSTYLLQTANQTYRAFWVKQIIPDNNRCLSTTIVYLKMIQFKLALVTYYQVTRGYSPSKALL